MFRDRTDAGKQLAKRVKKKDYVDPVVLAIPRGGVPVAIEVAGKIGASLDIVVARKIGAPGNPEYAVGAVTEKGAIVENENALKRTGASKKYVSSEGERQLKEVKRRINEYRQGKKKVDIQNKTAILVDDGVATGTTLKAAVKSVKSDKPKKIVVAVPVGAKESINELENMVDEVICLQAPRFFGAVGQYFKKFPQNTDEEVKRILRNYWEK